MLNKYGFINISVHRHVLCTSKLVLIEIKLWKRIYLPTFSMRVQLRHTVEKYVTLLECGFNMYMS